MSIPDGFPWIIFSPSKAHLFSNSSSLSPKVNHPWWLKSRFTESEKERRAADSATHNAADEPRPEPKGSSEVITTVAGLYLIHKEKKLEIKKIKINIQELKAFNYINKKWTHTLG